MGSRSAEDRPQPEAGGVSDARSEAPEAVPLLDLYTVALELVTPQDWPGELAETYDGACDLLGVPPRAKGYAMRLGLDSSGARYTVISRDVGGASGVLALWHDGVMPDWEPRSSTVAATRGGWPFWHVLGGLAGFPEPHDPDTDAYGVILRPPQGPEKIAASRRGLADSLADELATSGHQDTEAYRQARLMAGTTSAKPHPSRSCRAISICFCRAAPTRGSQRRSRPSTVRYARHWS